MVHVVQHALTPVSSTGRDCAESGHIFGGLLGGGVENAVEALKRQSPSAVPRIERQLGLDQLGVSLDTLVHAIVRPQGGDNDRLDTALKQHASGQGDQPDELGLYSP